MKSILKSELIKLLENHRDNDVKVMFDGYEIPISGISYSSTGDFIAINLHPLEVDTVKRIVQDSPLRQKVGHAKG